jgi:hypothetical protein
VTGTFILPPGQAVIEAIVAIGALTAFEWKLTASIHIVSIKKKRDFIRIKFMVRQNRREINTVFPVET